MLKLDPKRTALVAIDLQKGIVGMPIAPHPAATVIANSTQLAEALAGGGGTVVRVHVGFSANGADRLRQEVDQPMAGGPRPADWMDFVAEVAAWPSALEIVKRQWGAFHGTELDLQLRRRGLETIVLTGVATNFGVEQTARRGLAARLFDRRRRGRSERDQRGGAPLRHRDDPAAGLARALDRNDCRSAGQKR